MCQRQFRKVSCGHAGKEMYSVPLQQVAETWPWLTRPYVPRKMGKPLLFYSIQSESRSAMSDSLRPQGLYSPWNSPGRNTGVGSLCLLQGIVPMEGSNPGLLHCRWMDSLPAEL